MISMDDFLVMKFNYIDKKTFQKQLESDFN